tara:strand:+ start:2291 stop:2899 length:609 start_codon:yes stop_codon:yes gene_type:complete
MFITFEGIEGSGKTTQIQLLEQWLADQTIDYVTTLEPGGTKAGNALRQMLLEVPSSIQNPRSELFLFAADRCEHIEQVIQPNLKQGKWVICDRYIDSTYSYQYGGRQHLKQDVLDIIRLTGALEPDLTIVLDLPVEEGLRRAKNRADLDRFEQEELAFHQRVRDAYLDCEQFDRVAIIRTQELSVDDVFNQIVNEINRRRKV